MGCLHSSRVTTGAISAEELEMSVRRVETTARNSEQYGAQSARDIRKSLRHVTSTRPIARKNKHL